jgi:two-component system sensor histidine kinase RpfC
VVQTDGLGREPAQLAAPAPRFARAAIGILAFSAAVALAAWAFAVFQTPLGAAHPAVSTAIGLALILGPVAALFAFIFANPADVLHRFAVHPDSEPQQLFLQTLMTAALLAAVTIWAIVRPETGGARLAAAGMAAGVAASWCLLAHFILFPARDRGRKLGALVTEVATLSLLLHAGDQAAAPWFLIYLWLIFSYGFRFGPKWLLAASAVGCAGFAMVAATTPVWRMNWSISIGLLIALAILPAYVAMVIRRLSTARAEAEMVAAARARLFGLTSHELRTPLGAMMGLADLMRGPELSPEQTTMLDTIRSSAGAMLGMINDLLDFSKMEAGSVISRPSSFDLPLLLGDVASLVAPEASRKGLTVGCQIDPLLADSVQGHPIELRRVLIGLMSNAIRTTLRGEIRLVAKLAASDEASLSIRFEVRDTGPGLETEALRDVFEPFADSDRALAAGGRGLDLAMARELARMIGGTVTVASEPGVGSRFAVELPMAKAAQGLPRRLNSAAVGIYSSDPDLMRVLEDLPVLDTMGVRFAMLGELPENEQDAPAGYHLLVFDGRLDPVRALAAAARLGGRITRTAPATLVIANAGVVPHLAEMAPASVDTVLPWIQDQELLVRVFSRLLGRAEKVSQARTYTRSDMAAIAVDPIGSEPAPVAPGARFRVLIAEDNQTNRIVLERILARAGHQVLLAHDGTEALAALEAGGIDAAILDINMPELSGYHVAKLYRQMEPPGEHLPLIGLSAEATSETDRLCREAGMDAAVIKPASPEDMMELLTRLVQSTPQQRRVPITNMVVTPITAHPRFAREAAIIDSDALEALAGLGDEAFFLDVMDAFFADADQIIDALTRARDERDFKTFRDQIHAMRSSAVNVGAVRLCQSLLDVNDVSVEELGGSGATAALARLRGELGALKAELTKFTSQRRPAE